jgi:hypothetical protein
MNNLKYQNKVGFVLGTGRCGTKLMHDLMSKEPTVRSHHERYPLPESFLRYCQWHRLPIDHFGVMETLKKGIEKDLKERSFSFESSCYLSFSVKDLYEQFGAKFILIVRDPISVINSYYVKGTGEKKVLWYEHPYKYKDLSLKPGYQEYSEFHHFLSRFAPSGKEFQRWNKLTRIGKLAWFWKTVNESVIKQFDNLPETSWRVQKLEDLNYKSYQEICNFLGFKSRTDLRSFDMLYNSKPNSQLKPFSVNQWSNREKTEFLNELEKTAKSFGY